MVDVKQQNILIGGAGGGIGRPTTLELARAGAFVICTECPATRKAGEETLKQVLDAGGRGMFLELDLTDEESSKKAVAAAIEACAQVHAFVNLAGYVHTRGFLDSTMDDLRGQLEVHATGPIRVVQLLMPHWLEKQFGIFIPLTSIAAKLPAMGKIFYGVSKAAITNFAVALAQEYTHRGIRSIPLLPSRVGTASALERASQSEEAKKDLFGSQLSGRMIPPEVVAKRILHLLSPEGEYESGDIIELTNGASCGLKPVNEIPE